MIEGACLCGAARWQLQQLPESATACNCTTAYARGQALSFNFCPRCGCVSHWRGLRLDEQGRRRIAVNLRMTEPGPIAGVPIDHFDGLDTWDDLPRDGRCIKDMWF
jgi:hypothetical protein